MTPTRKRRLIIVCFVLAAVVVAAALIAVTLGENTNYLYSPSEVEAGHVPADATFRLGGVVLEKSVRYASDSPPAACTSRARAASRCCTARKRPRPPKSRSCAAGSRGACAATWRSRGIWKAKTTCRS